MEGPTPPLHLSLSLVEAEHAALRIHPDGVLGSELALQDCLRERVLDLLLHRALERTRAADRIEFEVHAIQWASVLSLLGGSPLRRSQGAPRPKGRASCPALVLDCKWRAGRATSQPKDDSEEDDFAAARLNSRKMGMQDYQAASLAIPQRHLPSLI